MSSCQRYFMFSLVVIPAVSRRPEEAQMKSQFEASYLILCAQQFECESCSGTAPGSGDGYQRRSSSWRSELLLATRPHKPNPSHDTLTAPLLTHKETLVKFTLKLFVDVFMLWIFGI